MLISIISNLILLEVARVVLQHMNLPLNLALLVHLNGSYQELRLALLLGLPHFDLIQQLGVFVQFGCDFFLGSFESDPLY